MAVLRASQNGAQLMARLASCGEELLMWADESPVEETPKGVPAPEVEDVVVKVPEHVAPGASSSTVSLLVCRRRVAVAVRPSDLWSARGCGQLVRLIANLCISPEVGSTLVSDLRLGVLAELLHHPVLQSHEELVMNLVGALSFLPWRGWGERKRVDSLRPVVPPWMRVVDGVCACV